MSFPWKLEWWCREWECLGLILTFNHDKSAKYLWNMQLEHNQDLFFGLTDWHVLLLFLQASILGSCFASQNDRSYSTTCTEQYSSPFICWSSSSRIYQTICLSPSLLLKIPVLASNLYFHNCLEEDVLGVFSSIWSRRKSTYLDIWSLSQHANFLPGAVRKLKCFTSNNLFQKESSLPACHL